MNANVTLISKLKGISSLIKKLRGTATMANTKINGGASPYPKSVGPADICTFTDGADNAPLKSLIFNIEPSQNLNGYSNPWPEGGGKNVLPYPFYQTTRTDHQVTFTDNGDGTITANGTATGGNATFYVTSGNDVYAGGAECILSGCPSGGSSTTYSVQTQMSGGSTYADWGSGKTLPANSTWNALLIIVRSGVQVNNLVFRPMVRRATESDSTWVPYKNICPINGWTSVAGARSSQNMLRLTPEITTKVENGVTGTPQADGTVNLNGTASANAWFPYNSGASTGDFCVPFRGKTMTAQVFPQMTGVHGVFTVFKEDGTYKNIATGSSDWASGPYTFVMPDDAYRFRFQIRVNSGTKLENVKAYITCTLGTQAATEVASYLPISIALGQTVYGGTLEPLSGKLTLTTAIDTITSFTSKSGSTQNNIYAYQGITSTVAKPSADSVTVDLLSNQFVKAHFGSTGGMYGNDVVGIAVNTNGTVYVGFGKNSEVNDLTKANTYATNNPIQVVYPLATPTEVTLTPTQVNSLLGVNNVWNNAGQTQLEYYPAQSSVVAVLNRNTRAYVAIPLKYIRYDTYQINPAQAIDLDSYRSETGLLIRNVVGSKAKIEFNTPMMNDTQWSEVWAILSAGFNNSNERKLKLKYFDTQSGSYKYGYFYVPDVQTPIRSIDEPNGVINYNEIRLAFIEY